MVQKLTLVEFLPLAEQFPVIDVRSPAEYKQAHIPGAYSLPLFTDEQRKVVGTIYKQQSREEAIKAGLDFFGIKMRQMVEEAEAIAAGFKYTDSTKSKTLLVHCWRGGMRSAAVAWLLDVYGFRVMTLAGGYKTFRTWALEQFNKPYNFRILGGYTGSGKTPTLKFLHLAGEPVIDLEDIAKHKGSAFGGFDHQQPRQEMFENLLAYALYRQTKQTGDRHIWLEDESRRIGDLNLPGGLWDTMRKSQLVFMEIPFKERLEHIIAEYAVYPKELLVDSIIRIRQRMGGLETKHALACIMENDFSGCFSILLRYYDKMYGQSLQNREGLEQLLTRFIFPGVEPAENAALLVSLTESGLF